MQTNLVTVSKKTFVRERDDLYADWKFDFWREFLQNSNDAKSANIDISIIEHKGASIFDRFQKEDVLRIGIKDDGPGMSRDVLEKVYFRMGETTKRKDGNNEEAGGYGRARLLTCFSQNSYTLITQDMYIEGDGPEYKIWTIPEARAFKQKILEELNTSDMDESLKESIGGSIQNTLDRLSVDYYKGCWFSVDIDKNMYGLESYRNPTVSRMRNKLTEYMKHADLRSRVTLNDVEQPGCQFKIKKRGRLATEGNLEFANVSSIDGETGYLMIRSGGKNKQPMFSTSISSDIPAHYIDLDPDKMMDVLTANRDGMKDEYAKALNNLMTKLSAELEDVFKKEHDKKNYMIEGGKGFISVSGVGKTVKNKTKHSGTVYTPGETSYVSLGRYDDKTSDEAKTLEEGNQDFSTYTLSPVIQKFIENNIDNFIKKGLFSAFYKADVMAYKRWIEDGLLSTIIQKDNELAAYLRMIADEAQRAHDIGEKRSVRRIWQHTYISIGDINKDIQKQIAKYNPENWRFEYGNKPAKGRNAAIVQAVFTACIEEALSALNKVRTPGDIKTVSGFFFEKSQENWDGMRFVYKTTAAHCKKLENTDNGEVVHAILLNPVDDDGNDIYSMNGDTKYKLSTDEGLSRLMSIAAHEVCHILFSDHNVYFANLLTDILGAVDRKALNKRVTEAVDNVTNMYRSNKIMVQEMDDEPGIRPWQKDMLSEESVDSTVSSTPAFRR